MTGATIRPNTSAERNRAAAKVWSVYARVQPELNNAHGLPEVAEKAQSVVPIVSTNGRPIGVIVSGPPAVPDEFLELLSRMAGQMFERAGKLEHATNMVQHVARFIKQATVAQNQCVSIELRATPCICIRTCILMCMACALHAYRCVSIEFQPRGEVTTTEDPRAISRTPALSRLCNASFVFSAGWRGDPKI